MNLFPYHFHQRHPFVLGHFLACELKAVALIEGYASGIVFQSPEIVRAESVYRKFQKLRSDAAALELRLNVELYHLRAVYADNSLDDAVIVVNKGAEQFLRAFLPSSK